MAIQSDTFKVVIPAELEKSKDGEWKVRGLASTNAIDKQGEVLMQKGMDLSPIDNQKGVINWDHQKGPENTLGLLDGYSRTDKGLYIEGRLFKNHTKAKSVQEIMSSLSKGDSGRMGLSVEGKIIERDSRNPKVINKCQINAVALTMNPVNTGTFVDLVKSMNTSDIEFNSVEQPAEEPSNEATFTTSQVLEIVQKALSVGDGYKKPPSELEGGAAMATSDMGKKKKDKKKKKEPIKTDTSDIIDKPSVLKSLSFDLYKSNIIEILDRLQKLYPGSSRSEIWNAVQERLDTKFPEISTVCGQDE